MTDLQNPVVPPRVAAVEIDAFILDLQMKLETSLSWVDHGFARAYRNIEMKSGQRSLYYPEIYLGVHNNVPNYYQVTPDNDKSGMFFFVVGKGRQLDYTQYHHNYLQHEVGIIFTANMEIINPTLIETDEFTQNLIRDVRECLTRVTFPKGYQIELVEECREFKEIFKEWSFEEDQAYMKAPHTAFRFNLRLTYQEECNPGLLDRCTAITNNISTEEKLTCVLPCIDFSTQEAQDALSAQQVQDLQDAFCGGVVPSGILYFRPIVTGQATDYGVGSEGWLLANGYYDYTPPTNPAVIARLDTSFTDGTHFWRLADNNAFGHKFRFTGKTGGYYDPSDGNWYTVGGVLSDRATELVDNYIIDHLTGHGLLETDQLLGEDTWPNQMQFAVNLNAGGFSDWRSMNSDEYNLVTNQEVATGTLNEPYVYTGTSSWFCTTDPANAVQAYLTFSNNEQLLTRTNKASLRRVFVIRNHYT